MLYADTVFRHLPYDLAIVRTAPSKNHPPQNILSLSGGGYFVGTHIVHADMLFQAGDVDADGIFAVLGIAAVDSAVNFLV